MSHTFRDGEKAARSDHKKKVALNIQFPEFCVLPIYIFVHLYARSFFPEMKRIWIFIDKAEHIRDCTRDLSVFFSSWQVLRFLFSQKIFSADSLRRLILLFFYRYTFFQAFFSRARGREIQSEMKVKLRREVDFWIVGEREGGGGRRHNLGLERTNVEVSGAWTRRLPCPVCGAERAASQIPTSLA